MNLSQNLFLNNTKNIAKLKFDNTKNIAKLKFDNAKKVAKPKFYNIKKLAKSKFDNNKKNTIIYFNSIANEISENPNLLNPFKFPINYNKINTKNYNILFPHTFKVEKITLLFYIIYFFVLFFSILKYVNLNNN